MDFVGIQQSYVGYNSFAIYNIHIYVCDRIERLVTDYGMDEGEVRI
jgi:hypothetical protein